MAGYPVGPPPRPWPTERNPCWHWQYGARRCPATEVAGYHYEVRLRGLGTDIGPVQSQSAEADFAMPGAVSTAGPPPRRAIKSEQ